LWLSEPPNATPPQEALPGAGLSGLHTTTYHGLGSFDSGLCRTSASSSSSFPGAAETVTRSHSFTGRSGRGYVISIRPVGGRPDAGPSPRPGRGSIADGEVTVGEPDGVAPAGLRSGDW
jgi:hypothetical protein